MIGPRDRTVEDKMVGNRGSGHKELHYGKIMVGQGGDAESDLSLPFVSSCVCWLSPWSLDGLVHHGYLLEAQGVGRLKE